jgi:hypothetical protein
MPSHHQHGNAAPAYEFRCTRMPTHAHTHTHMHALRMRSMELLTPTSPQPLQFPPLPSTLEPLPQPPVPLCGAGTGPAGAPQPGVPSLPIRALPDLPGRLQVGRTAHCSHPVTTGTGRVRTQSGVKMARQGVLKREHRCHQSPMHARCACCHMARRQRSTSLYHSESRRRVRVRSGIVNNRNLSRFTRYNAMQARGLRGLGDTMPAALSAAAGRCRSTAGPLVTPTYL